MVVSPTGTFRQQIPSLRTGIKSRINEANNLLDRQIPHDLAEIEEIQEKIASCNESLTQAATKIRDVDKAWGAKLQEIDEEIEEDERKFYETFATHAEDGYYCLLYEADGLCARLRARFSRLRERRQQPHVVGTLPTTQPTGVPAPQAGTGPSPTPASPTSGRQQTAGSTPPTIQGQQSTSPNNTPPGPPPTSGAQGSAPYPPPTSGVQGSAPYPPPTSGAQGSAPNPPPTSGAQGSAGGPPPNAAGTSQPNSTGNTAAAAASAPPNGGGQPPHSSGGAHASGNSGQTAAGSNHIYSGINMKLPKFQLPAFDGKITEFKEIWSIFDAAVHRRTDIPDVMKMSYLLSQLKGEAQKSVKGYPVDDENYTVIVQILHDRFSRAGDRLRSLLHAELKRLPRSGKSVQEKRETMNECERIFRQLEINEGGSLDPGASLVFDLLSKFPVGMIWDLDKRFKIGVYSKLSEVRATINEAISNEELTGSFVHDLTILDSGDSKAKKGGSKGTNGGGHGKGSSGAGSEGGPERDHTFMSKDHRGGHQGGGNRGGQQGGGNRRGGAQGGAKGGGNRNGDSSVQTPCMFCQGWHRPGLCRTYISGKARLERLKELKRCTRCTRVHGGKCDTSLTCTHCGKPHHSLLCFSRHPVPNRSGGGGSQAGSHEGYPAYPTGHPGYPNGFQTGHTFYSGSQSGGPGLSGPGYPQTTPGGFGFQPVGAFGPTQAPQTGPGGFSYQPGGFGGGAPQTYPGGFNMFNPPTQAGTGGAGASKPPGGQSGQNHANSASEVTNFSRSSTKNSIFQTALIPVMNQHTGHALTLRLCVDTLSNRTYITEEAANRLQLKTNYHDKLFVSVFGSRNSVEVSSRSVSFGLVKREGYVRTVEANTTRMISNSSFLPSEWPEYAVRTLGGFSNQLADNPFDPIKTCEILLGADYAWDVIRGGKIDIPGSGMFLIPSVFGYLLGGQLYYSPGQWYKPEYTMLCLTESHSQFPSEVGLIAQDAKLESRYPDVDEFMKLEVIGISDCPVEDDDSVAQSGFRESVKFRDGRYHVKWPYIEDKKDLLPTNFDTAYARFRSLGPRLQTNPSLLETYRQTIRDQVERGFIERVPINQLKTTHPVHYLPHHPVFKPSSATTKVRIVYDASSKSRKGDVSLNECMFRGPVILPDLCQLLIRFRSKKTVIVSDIEKAFLQVALQMEDRDVTRFLWFKDDSYPDPSQDNLAVYRFCRVPFGIICSPFLLGATIQHHLERQNSEFAKQLMSDIYVDNVISGIPDGMTPLEYYEKTKTIFASAGMNLREFCSNSPELMSQLPAADRMKDPDTKVLGLQWDSAGDDTLRLSSSAKWKEFPEVNSKRTVLQAIASLFDPLGFFQPSVFEAKVFLQRLWSLEKGWDEKLDDTLIKRWEEVWTSLCQAFTIRIPRFAGHVTPESVLVAFGDASGVGYGTVVYLRTRTNASTWCTNLLFSKSRLAPQKRLKNQKRKKFEVSLPRLELLGAHIAALAASFCRDALRMGNLKIVLFSDSECVLHWLSSQKQLKRFVRRRVEKILSVNNCEFRYVSTTDNPADYLTRGKSVSELLETEAWWHGPSFLGRDEQDWPDTRVPPTSAEVLRKVKEEQQSVTVTFVATEAPEEVQPFGIKFTDFSSLSRLIRVICRCFTFLKTWLWDRLSDDTRRRYGINDIIQEFAAQPHPRLITPGQYEAALRFVVKGVQASAYGDVLKAIKENKKPLLVKQLNLQLDANGLLRVCSRFNNADLPEAARYPVIIPKNHEFSKLVVLEVHERLHHVGPTHTLSELRREFWVPQGRAFVKKTLKPCIKCKMSKPAPAFGLPAMPPWPKERVSRSAPFQFVGIDYFGPMKVKVANDVQKMWACLFTCLSTRAVHIEAVLDCSSTEFFKSFVRFISRRGYPQQVISDHGAQFQLTKILADKSWKEIPVDESLLSYSARHGIQWKFITELAPWQGGHYERLVGVVKSVLKTAVGRRLLSWSDLVTLLTETEAIVNSRPITYVNSDVDSTHCVLRPVDFLLYRPINAPPVGSTDFPVRDLGDAGKLLASVWKQRERYLDKLWSVWYDEYLLNLRERANALHRQGRMRTDRVPRVGEVVLLKDQNVPRAAWKLAIVTDLIHGADKKVRAATVRLGSGVTLRRTINFLVPLEISSPAPSAPDNSTDTPDNTKNSTTNNE